MSRSTHRDIGADRADRGFTLVEILIAIVLVGVLSAVVVVGISSLTDQGSASACQASQDAAKTGATAYFATTGSFPTTFNQMTTRNPPTLTLSNGVSIAPSGTAATGSGWTLTMTPGSGLNAPTFACATGSGSAAPSGTAACPGTFTGWTGEYYSNSSLAGTPTLCRDDANLNFSWGGSSPATGLPLDQFSARWTKSVVFSAGSHTFTLGSDDGSRLYIDGALVRDFWNDHAYATSTVTQTLTAGAHIVMVEFYENGGQAGCTLSWT